MTAESHLDDLVARLLAWRRNEPPQFRHWPALWNDIRDAADGLVALRARVEELEADKLAILNGAGSIVGSTIDAGSERIETLEVEVLALRTALRAHAIRITPLGEYKFVYECVQCGDHSWREFEPERHAPNCLAEQIEKDKGG